MYKEEYYPTIRQTVGAHDQLLPLLHCCEVIVNHRDPVSW